MAGAQSKQLPELREKIGLAIRLSPCCRLAHKILAQINQHFDGLKPSHLQADWPPELGVCCKSIGEFTIKLVIQVLPIRCLAHKTWRRQNNIILLR